MKKDFIKNYVKNISKEDIINYLSKECVPHSDKEVDLIYKAIKNNFDIIMETDFMSYISDYKLIFNEELYKTIIEKYNKYKKFID